MTNPIDRALAQADRIVDANRRLEEFTAAHPRTMTEAGLSASDVVDAAIARYRRDPLAHMRAELAVRVFDTQAGRAAVELEDPRTFARAGAVIALELVERGRLEPAGDHLAPRDVLAATVTAHGAPRPVELADVLLDALERAGYAVTRR